MLLEISGEITPERMKGLSQRKNNTQLWNGTGDRSKVQCCKEQYCTGTWNVRSMNQGKLKVVKQEIKKKKQYREILIVPLGHVVWNINLKMSRRELGIYGLSSNCFLADNTLGLE